MRTKLYIPSLRPGVQHVSRSRLLERLNAGVRSGRKLTLVSAPAGFGKTTLVSEWIHALVEATSTRAATGKTTPSTSIAWLSLDENDSDLTRFLVYVIAALQAIEADIGKGALGALQSPQPPPAEDILTLLINEITTLPNRIVLVLDDYHLIDAQPIHDALAFLLRRLPPQMHLIIATREDPPLPLARLRARGQLTELRGADLRFSSSEAAVFLNRAMGLDLSAHDIAALERRTEGWVAGLQLAAISMQGREDPNGFIQSFTGSHHFVLDYLVEEVLEQQSESVQAFLLQTAILDRLTGSLCDAVMDRALIGQQDGQATLEALEYANLFIIPLDEERCWYRYHHLFADLIRRRLQQAQPEQVSTLYCRASEWYEQNGFSDEAIEHALRAADFERAARLIAEQVDETWQMGEHSKLWRWLEGLPASVVLAKPDLCVFRAQSLLDRGQPDAAEQCLQVAERALGIDTDDPTGTRQMQQDLSHSLDRKKLRGRIAVTRALLAFFYGDVSAIVRYARQALGYLPEQDSAWRSRAAIALGDAHRIEGDLDAAYRARLEALETSKAAGNVYMILVASMKLAVTMRQQGRLVQAKQACEQQLQLAQESGLSQTGLAGGFLAIWGEVLAELDDLEEALDRTQEGLALAECGEDMVVLGWSYLCRMRVLFTGGDTIRADKLIQRIGSRTRESDIPPWITRMMAAWRVRLWLAQGELLAASNWAKKRDPGVDNELEFLREFEGLVLARILMAQGRLNDSATLLQRLLEAADTTGRISSAIEILIVQSLVLEAQGDTDQAMSALETALNRAEPGGFIRTFVDEGPPMARLLYKALSRGIAPEYTRRLLAAFPDAEPEQAGPPDAPTLESALFEPLSERELEVLALLAEGWTNREIASRLYLALNTIKAHASNIYGKLGVHNRTQAVARARALGLLPIT